MTAIFTACALLFAQLAVAAYSCPMLDNQDMASGSGVPCDLEMVDNANLCDNHCKNGSASFESAKTSAASPQAVDSGLRVPSLHALTPRLQAMPSPRITPATSPPLVRFSVLRI
jgi:hypothetical protein